MATSIKLKSDIKKIEAAIKSKATPKSLVPKLQSQLEKIKDELASLSSPKPKKGVTKTKVLSSLQKLKAKVKSTKSLAGYKKSGIDLKKDADVPALPLGKRYSQTTGNPYYEYRLNRADVKQPPKRYPKLEDGGMMADGGNVKYMVQVFDENDKIIESKIIKATNQTEANEMSFYHYPSSFRKEYKVERVRVYPIDSYADGGMMDENSEYASGGRIKSAVNRDRAYKSDEAWEQSYKRKSRPKNPKYASSDKGMFEKGGYMEVGGILEVGDKVIFKGNKYNVSKITNENVGGFIDTKWHLDSTKIGVKDVVLDSPKGVTKISDSEYMSKSGYMAKGGETVKYYGRDFVNTFDISKNDFVDAINSYYDTGSDVNYERVSARLNISKLTKKLGEEKSKELFGYIKNKFEKKGVFADGGYMADGGMLKHGLMIGDEIIGYSGDVVQVQNRGNFFVVNLQEGKREMLDKFRMDKYAQGGELHRLEQGK